MANNQISTIVLDERTDKKQVKYLNKDFSDFKKNLVEFTKFYFSDTYQDFSDASPGSIFLDMASYVGDVLSYYTDHSFKENLLAHATEKESIVSLAQGFGYKPIVVTPAFCTVSMSALIPVDTNGDLDTKYLPRFLPGTSFSATTQADSGTFITQDVCDFADITNREVKPFAVDSDTGLPSSLVVSKPIKVVAASEKIFKVSVGSPTKFLKIEIPEDKVVDIKSVVDAEGNTWNEVDNLSQDYIFQDTIVSTSGDVNAPLYSLKTVKTNRRFVTKLNRKFKTELVFGSGTGDLSDVYDNPDYKSVYDTNYLQNMTNVALDTLNFTTGNSFGLAPGDTTLTITYRIAGGISSNVGSGNINKINNLITGNEIRVLSSGEQTTFNGVLSSVSVINDEAARGGGSTPTIEQMRQSAIGYVNAQRRIVTATDYEKRILSMPAKYGTVYRAFVVKDDAINYIKKMNEYSSRVNSHSHKDPDGGEQVWFGSLDPEDDINLVADDPLNTNVNLYVLGLDSNRRITTLNDNVKSNIKQFLKGYRMLTDRINIVDAFRVSIGIDYSIVVYKGFNNSDVLVRCSDVVRKYFDIDKWQINQPIIKDDLLVQIAGVNGVQAVTRLEFINKYQQQDGSDYAPYTYKLSGDASAEKNRIIYPSADPCIFELRYPQTDIVGSAVQ